jgi:hypothetical protein
MFLLSSNKIISAARLLTSLPAIPMATPMSAFFNADESTMISTREHNLRVPLEHVVNVGFGHIFQVISVYEKGAGITWIYLIYWCQCVGTVAGKCDFYLLFCQTL